MSSTGHAPPEPSEAGGAKREGDITSTWDRAVGVRGVLARGKSGEDNRDVTGGQRWGSGGGSGRVKTSNVETTKGL